MEVCQFVSQRVTRLVHLYLHSCCLAHVTELHNAVAKTFLAFALHLDTSQGISSWTSTKKTDGIARTSTPAVVIFGNAAHGVSCNRGT